MREVLLLDHEHTRLPSDFRLMRLVEWAGFALADFSRLTVRFGEVPLWSSLPAVPKVVVPMGPHALGSSGIGGSLLDVRGYVHAGGPLGSSVLPTVGPGYIQRGNSRWSAAFINDLQKAVTLARVGRPLEFRDYLLDPRPDAALAWARDYRARLAHAPDTYLAFDIETPGKGDDEEVADTDSDAPDRTWRIERIGFSCRAHGAISFPWSPEYLPAVRMVLGTHGPKVVWNAGFDVPRLRRVGVGISGIIHDGMVAWHVLHSDLPKSLKFVATFTCPWQEAWKHLSGSRPAFYNATDADVELRSMLEIERGLRSSGLWDVYDRDVVQLEPILVHMHRVGMPIDAEVRLQRAQELARRLDETRAAMVEAVPLGARKVEHVYNETPKSVVGLQARPGVRVRAICPGCGLERPRKDHFRVLKKRVNPCGGLVAEQREVAVTEYYRLAEWTPSNDQLTRYHQHLRRPLPMVYDRVKRARKVSFAERQLKDLTNRYPSDTLYPLILKFRQLDKIAGTYIGRPIE